MKSLTHFLSLMSLLLLAFLPCWHPCFAVIPTLLAFLPCWHSCLASIPALLSFLSCWHSCLVGIPALLAFLPPALLAFLPCWHSCHAGLPFGAPCLLLHCVHDVRCTPQFLASQVGSGPAVASVHEVTDIPSLAGVPAGHLACCCWRPKCYWHPFNCLLLICVPCLLLLASMMLLTYLQLLASPAAQKCLLLLASIMLLKSLQLLASQLCYMPAVAGVHDVTKIFSIAGVPAMLHACCCWRPWCY